MNLQSTVFEFWPRMRNRELYIDQITKFHLFKLSFCTLFWWCTKNSGRLQARILQTEIGDLIFWVFFRRIRLLHQTALSLVNSIATCCLRIQSSKRCLYEYMYIDSASIILYQISMLEKNGNIYQTRYTSPIPVIDLGMNAI